MKLVVESKKNNNYVYFVLVFFVSLRFIKCTLYLKQFLWSSKCVHVCVCVVIRTQTHTHVCTAESVICTLKNSYTYTSHSLFALDVFVGLNSILSIRRIKCCLYVRACVCMVVESVNMKTPQHQIAFIKW